MVATHQDPSVLQAIDQRFENEPLLTIVGELEGIVDGLPATPASSFGLSTPPLDADELEKQLVSAAETRSQSGCTDIENGSSKGITESCEATFKKVLEMYVSISAHSQQRLLTPA